MSFQQRGEHIDRNDDHPEEDELLHPLIVHLAASLSAAVPMIGISRQIEQIIAGGVSREYAEEHELVIAFLVKSNSSSCLYFLLEPSRRCPDAPLAHVMVQTSELRQDLFLLDCEKTYSTRKRDTDTRGRRIDQCDRE